MENDLDDPRGNSRADPFTVPGVFQRRKKDCKIKRSEFIYLGAGALAAALLERGCGVNTSSVPRLFGLQLYSVRDEFEKDPAGTIRKLANFGYTHLESYERNNDMFWGLGPKGFRQLMDELGMKLVSSHCEIEHDFQRRVDEAAEAGLSYLVHNWPHATEPITVYQAMAEKYNRFGELCSKAGLRFANHNYSSPYSLLDGIYPQDLLMERTDASLVYHQMDIYWVWRAGQDPIYWLRKFPGRYKLAHVKDGNNSETTLLDKGRLKLEKILAAGKETGIDYLLVEQEHYQNMDSMEAAERNARWMNSVAF